MPKIFSKFYNEEYDANKPTIVFLHEALGSVSLWKDFPNKVIEMTDFNAFAYDRLGHGQSSPSLKKRGLDYLQQEAWEILPSVLEQFNIENPILFGHSDGGSIALLYASKFSTKALISEAGHVFCDEYTLQGITKAQDFKPLWIEKLKRYHGDKTEDLWSAWTDTWLDPSFHNWNIEAVLKGINCPSLIIQGENDEYGTKEQVQSIVTGIGGNVKDLMIPDCGHTPHREKEDIILSNILNFFQHHV